MDGYIWRLSILMKQRKMFYLSFSHPVLHCFSPGEVRIMWKKKQYHCQPKKMDYEKIAHGDCLVLDLVVLGKILQEKYHFQNMHVCFCEHGRKK